MELGGDCFQILDPGEPSSTTTLVLAYVLAGAPDGVGGDRVDHLGVPPIADDDDAWDVLPTALQLEMSSGREHSIGGGPGIFDAVGECMGVSEEGVAMALEAAWVLNEEDESSQGSESDDTIVEVGGEKPCDETMTMRWRGSPRCGMRSGRLTH